MERHERVAEEVEAGQGKQPPPRTTLIKHNREHDNTTSAHKVVHTATLTVEPPPGDRVPGEYNPPPPDPDPPPPLHLGLTTTQLRLTTEEAKEAHQECTCTQRGLQEEMDQNQGE